MFDKANEGKGISCCVFQLYIGFVERDYAM